MDFDGFGEGTFDTLAVPPGFISRFLAATDNLAELKLLLFCCWALPQKPAPYRYVRRDDLLRSETCMTALGVIDTARPPETLLDAGLQAAVERGSLLQVTVTVEGRTETLYLVNTPQGQRTVERLDMGDFQPGDLERPVELLPERPNLFKLYEDNFGVLTPMIVDELKALEADYPAAWLPEAMQIAVRENKRRISYVRGILKRWQSEGKSHEESTRRPDQSDEGTGQTGKYDWLFEG
jgi:DNA replication protein